MPMSPQGNPSKVLLLADARGSAAVGKSAPIRRFRIARLRLDGRPAVGASRFDHLKRVYD